MTTRDVFTGRRIDLTLLDKKNYRASVVLADPAKFEELVAADPGVPRTYAQLRRLAASLFPREHRPRFRKDEPPKRGLLKPRFQECGEALMSQLFAGLANPALTVEQREGIERDMDADLPAFENVHETDHFVLRWTNSSATAGDNIADGAIVTETAGYLESAWTTYNTVFGRPPYVAPGQTKIEVVFYDIGGFGVTTPNGPIELDAPNWVSQPGIRQPTSAHELFHRLQYAFGYRTTWTPVSPYQWFSEGTASWAEVFKWQRVSSTAKITQLFTSPDLDLEQASYSACPFWIFFQTRQEDFPGDNPMLTFLQKYETNGDDNAALAQTIDEDWPANNVYGQLDTFFALFARDRRLGHWKSTPSGGNPYATILGPNGAAITPSVSPLAVSLGSGDTYTLSTTVSPLGSDYYRIAFEPDAAGHTLSVSITTSPGGTYSYYLIWERAGSWTSASFPFFASGDHSFTQPVDLSTADALVLVVSGRGVGGSYTLTASVS